MGKHKEKTYSLSHFLQTHTCTHTHIYITKPPHTNKMRKYVMSMVPCHVL